MSQPFLFRWLMGSAFRSPKKWALVATLFLLFALLSSAFTPWTKQSLLSYPVRFAEHLWFLGSNQVTSWWNQYIGLRDVHLENQELRQEILRLKQLLTEQIHRSEDMDQLKSLLEFKNHSPDPLLLASVMSSGGRGFFERIQINKGTQDQLAVGMPAVTPFGVVGLIARVGMHSAYIQPLTSIRSSIDILVARTRLRGVIKGSGTGSLLWEPRRREDIQIGDLVISSGLVGLIPKGYPVATVAKITYNMNLATQLVELHPTAELSRIEYVFLVKVDAKDPQL